MNIVDAIGYQARVRPDALAIADSKRVFSYAAADAATRRIAALLEAQGVGPGDVVGIAMQTTPFHLLMLLSLARLGAVSVSIHPDSPPGGRMSAVAHFGVKAVIAVQRKFAVEGCPLILADPSWMEPRKTTPDRRPAHEGNERPWHIHLSSGTTGKPKGVVRTHMETLNVVYYQRTAIEGDSNARFLCRMDLNTGANLMRVLRHLFIGDAVVFTKPAVEDVFESINRYSVTHTFASPIMIDRWLKVLPQGHRGFPSLVHFAVGGSKMSAALRRQIIQRLTPNVYATYGSTETALLAVAAPGILERFPESVGHVVPWIEAQTVDEEDRPLPAGKPGIVRFRGLGIAKGYYRNPAATAKSFRNGWFYSGDTATLTPDGILAIEARVDDMINLGGPKVNPALIEDVLARHPDVVEAAAFGKKVAGGNDVVMAAVVTSGNFDEQALRKFCHGHLGKFTPLRIFAMRELPRNPMGKVLRRELAQRIITKETPAQRPPVEPA